MSTNTVILGNRRELFLDDYMIASMKKGATKVFHKPVRREVVFSMDRPEEFTNCSNYLSFVKDGDRYLLYYRAGARIYNPEGKEKTSSFLCVAETYDGKNFKRCKVDLLPESESAVINCAMTEDIPKDPDYNVCPGVSTVFKDTNPDCLPEERFKMLVGDETSYWEWDDKGGYMPKSGLYLFVSPDGFNFKRKSKSYFNIPNRPCYDTANIAFFDESVGEYRLYIRRYEKIYGTIRRTITTGLTPDFVDFHDFEMVKFDRKFKSLFKDGQQLYTNNVMKYFRAPHIYLGFPARYYDAGEYNSSMLNLPSVDLRAFRAGWSLREATAITDTVLMSSRDGWEFNGVPESFIRPGINMEDTNWIYGDTYMAYGIVPTASDQGDGAPDEMSFYIIEGYGTAGTTTLRRCSLRMDGFASINFSAFGGTLQTKPFTFEGDKLTLNISASGFGRFKVAFLDENGKMIPGYTLDDAVASSGDGLELVARWKEKGCNVSELAGKTVSMIVEARDADLYSFQFVKGADDIPLPEPQKRGEECRWR